VSEKALIITGSLAISGLVSTGPGGLSWAPLNPGNFRLSSNLFLGVVFSIFAFSGWDSTGPMAEESKNPQAQRPDRARRIGHRLDDLLRIRHLRIP